MPGLNTFFDVSLGSASGQTNPDPSNHLPVESFFVTEDINDFDRISIELKDTDLPFGFPREIVAFESGGEFEIAEGGIYNPGSDRPVLQMMQAKEMPLVIKGRFRDKIYANAQLGEFSDHARFMRDQFERLRRRANPLKISWAGDERAGVLWKTKFGEEGQHDIQYELTFFISIPPTGNSQNVQSLVPSFDDVNALVATLAAELAAQQALMLAQALTVVINTALSNALGGVSSSFVSLQKLTQILVRGTFASTQALFFNVNQVVTGCAAVQANIAILKALLAKTRMDAAMQNRTADANTSWWSQSFSMEVLLNQILDALRQIAFQARQKVRQSTKVYRVQPGDTLESIARSQLGSSGRVSDLGINQHQLIPGKYIRLPINSR